ncbi:stage III sporulation protein AD [Fervidicella metallireducens AeB]|uniref:Stage III sporulation protein AD n=1 Tax=Fervidicella metallireducens AeB TaxID=1403537 RepID=A0A017RY41_9CLOT|nr:stage III sporulation protein AD [Fervidicella metallireducens]EYE89693.1 stage III sporulation protein AD [Fervidicella metallireducens AeB]
MDISKVLVIGLLAAMIVVLLKNEKPEIALQISLATGIVIFLLMLSKLTVVVEALQQIALKINIDVIYLNTVLKIIGIAYLASFGVEICKDSGQSSIASKIEFAGKILIITLAIPVLMAVMDMVLKIMP